MACSRRTRRRGRLPSPSALRWRKQPAHRPRSVRRLVREPPMLAPRRALSGACCPDPSRPGCSSRYRWSVLTAVRTCASSPSSPRPSQCSASLLISGSPPSHCRSPPPAWDDAPDPAPDWNPLQQPESNFEPFLIGISALPGSGRLSKKTVQPHLRHAAPPLKSPAPHNAHACTAPDTRQPRCSVLTTDPAPAIVLLRANLGAHVAWISYPS
jgi:hypothetical protein